MTLRRLLILFWLLACLALVVILWRNGASRAWWGATDEQQLKESSEVER